MADTWEIAARTIGSWPTVVRRFVVTLAIVMVEGAVIAAAVYGMFRGNSWAWVAAVGLVLFQAFIAGVMLGLKRALFLSLIDGVRTLQLGRSGVRLLFDRVLGLSADGSSAGGGERIAAQIERLPLAEAERVLNSAVHRYLAAEQSSATPSSGIRRMLESKLLAVTAKLTLARFRKAVADGGGIDLVKVRAELEPQIDELLAAKLRRGVNLWMIVVLVGLPLVVAAETYVTLAILRTE